MRFYFSPNTSTVPTYSHSQARIFSQISSGSVFEHYHVCEEYCSENLKMAHTFLTVIKIVRIDNYLWLLLLWWWCGCCGVGDIRVGQPVNSITITCGCCCCCCGGVGAVVVWVLWC